MNTPLVSVVMPVYNGEKSLPPAIESVLKQTYEHFELIILDNCSTDGTAQIIASFTDDPRVKLHRNPELLPVMQNHNAVVALKSPSAEYMQILQADDVLSPTCLEQKVRVAQANPTCDIVGSFVTWGDAVYPTRSPGEGEFFCGKQLAGRVLIGELYPFLSPSCVLFRSSAIDQRTRMYDEVKLHGDIQACYEILRNGDFGFVHETLVTVGRSVDSVSSKKTAPMDGLLASNLELLIEYGRDFLDEAMFQKRVDLYLDNYYQKLAKASFERRPDGYWSLHKSTIKSANRTFEPARLAKEMFRRLLSHPHATASALKHKYLSPKIAGLSSSGLSKEG